MRKIRHEIASQKERKKLIESLLNQFKQRFKYVQINQVTILC